MQLEKNSARSRVYRKPEVGSRVHSNPEVDSAHGRSQWREKYGVRARVEQSQIEHLLMCADGEGDPFSCVTKNQCSHEDKPSPADWIATGQDNTEKESLVPRAYFEALTTDCTPADKDAVDVITQMNKLLDGVLPSRCISVDFRDVDFHKNSGLDRADDFDTKFASYLQAPSIDAQLKVKSASSNAIYDEAFSGESMAILFRRSHDEKITKLLRNRVFFGWKRIARDTNDTDDGLIRRFQRQHRLRHIRQLFSSWLKLRAASHDLLKRAAHIHALRMSHRGLIAWSRLSRRKKSRRADHVRRINMANNIRNTNLKHSFFVRWLHYKRGNNDKLKSRKVGHCSHEVNARSVVIVEEDDCRPTSIGQDITPDKIVPLGVPVTVQHTKCDDDNDNQRKGTKKINLLIPLGYQRRKTGIPSNPNLVLKMNQRKEEREKGRERLRQRYEQKAIEKQQRLEEERLRREEAEMKVQREFVQRKTIEEQRKKMAAERWKRACRLAALHYQMSLQKRMLLQWKRIFQVLDFHERKASIAWSDTTYEKCWQGWISFKNEEQRKRSGQMLKQHKLADDFNDRRLLAKSLAALEEHGNYSKSLLEEAKTRVSEQRQRSILAMWRNVTRQCNTVRRANVDRAKRNGKRLTLSVAIKSWRCGVRNSQHERELKLLIESKWEQWGLCRSRID